MSLPGNARWSVADAPHGLALVQELLNTALTGAGTRLQPELLADGPAAQRWIADVAPTLGLAPGAADDDGAARLRRVREAVRAAVARDGAAGPAVTETAILVPLRFDKAGIVAVTAAADPAGLAARTLAEVLRAQARGDWPRLKLCALSYCGVAFWDRSRNVSARYHAGYCANYVNLRSSRARRRDG